MNTPKKTQEEIQKGLTLAKRLGRTKLVLAFLVVGALFGVGTGAMESDPVFAAKCLQWAAVTACAYLVSQGIVDTFGGRK